MTNNYADIITYTKHRVEIAVGKGTVTASGYGDARVTTYTAASGAQECTFTKVIHVPELVAKLLSTESLRTKHVYYRTDHQYLFMKHHGKDIPIADVHSYHGLPHLVRPLDGAIARQSAIALNSSKIARKPEASLLT